MRSPAGITRKAPPSSDMFCSSRRNDSYSIGASGYTIDQVRCGYAVGAGLQVMDHVACDFSRLTPMTTDMTRNSACGLESSTPSMCSLLSCMASHVLSLLPSLKYGGRCAANVAHNLRRLPCSSDHGLCAGLNNLRSLRDLRFREELELRTSHRRGASPQTLSLGRQPTGLVLFSLQLKLRSLGLLPGPLLLLAQPLRENFRDRQLSLHVLELVLSDPKAPLELS